MELLRLLWFACTEQPWWTPIGWVGGHELEPLVQGGEYFVPAVEKEMSPLTFCTPLHTGRLVCLFFNPSIYESMIMKIVHICVQYVLIVCLNVLSTLFSYFSLTSKKKIQSECHDHFTRLKMTLGCFFASCLSNSSLWAVVLRSV